jgi:hypothetical protein
VGTHVHSNDTLIYLFDVIRRISIYVEILHARIWKLSLNDTWLSSPLEKLLVLTVVP